MTPGIIINFEPSLKQQKAWDYLMDEETSFVGYGGAAYGGKSYLECNWVTIMSIAYPDTAWALGRRELSVLRRTTLLTLFKVFDEYNIKPDRDYKYNQQTNTIAFSNRSQIFLIDTAFQPSDPLYTRFGGLELTGAAVDESAETDEGAINILYTRTGRRNNHKYKIGRKFLECFNPDKGHVYRRYYKPWKEGKLKASYKFVQAFPSDNPSPDAAEYVRGILENSDKVTIERLIHGNFEYDDDPAALMSYDAIIDLFSNTHVQPGYKCITSDIARLGGDRITAGQWEGYRVKIKSWQKEPLDVTGGRIEQLRLSMAIGKSDVLVDEDGVGGGIVDFMKYKGFVNNSRPLPPPESPGAPPENFDNLKSQCYFRFAKLVNEKKIYIECEDWMRPLIIEELEQVKQKAMDTDGKKGVVPKERVKEILGRSPDFSDMLMQRIWFDLKPQFKVIAA